MEDTTQDACPANTLRFTAQPSTSDVAGGEQSVPWLGDQNTVVDPALDTSSPDMPFALQPELTDQTPGGATPHDDNIAPVPKLPRFDPRALLNPKSSREAKRPASSGEDTEPAVAGQVSLVERLHNVQERTASPAKRVKTHEPQPSHANFAGGSSLDLQHSGKQPPEPPQGLQIDLTMSDDEDVKIIGSKLNDDVCLGKVKQTYIQAHTVPFPDPKKHGGVHGAQGRIKVSLRRGGGQKHNFSIMVTDSLQKEFGRVDMKTAQGLAPLIDGAKASGLKWMAWTEQRRKQPNEGPPGSPFSGLIGMTLQLYAPQKNAVGVGKSLKGRNLVLEAPVFELQRHDYFNPQTGEHFPRNQMNQPATQNAMYQFGHGHGASSNYVLRSVDEIRADVEDVFDTVVTSSEVVPTREPSHHINTELYPHQKQALYFMVDKEQDHSGAEHDDRKDSLWKPHYRDNGRKSYLHVITGEEMTEKPKSNFGGILADEMGLGKTLSILSLIADDLSMRDARAFQERRPPPVPPTSGLLQPTFNSRATLLVCPLSTMTNWKEQIKEHFPEGSALRWTRYHGTERYEMSAKDLAKYDIVVTTYHIIAKDIIDRRRPLPYINWFRIVLDEAHTIRNPTQQSKATCVLNGQRRWAVTGTPVQNRLEDLGALFNFIRLKPFDSNAGFNQFILHPFKNADPDVVPKLQLLVSTVTIRRTKEIIKHAVPPKSDLIVRLPFSREEQQLHDWFEKDTQRKVAAVTQGDKMGGSSYAKILTAILNLRLICAHGRDLLSEEALKTTDGMTYDNPMEIGDEDVVMSKLTRQQAYEMLSLLHETTSDDCIYCPGRTSILDSLSDDEGDDEDDDGSVQNLLGEMTTCYHVVCPKHRNKLRKQWKDNMEPDGTVVCHVCDDRNKPAPFQLLRNEYNEFVLERDRIRKDPKLSKKIGSYTGPHTKTQALLNDLGEFQKWSDENPQDRPIKSIVFSSWTTHLDLIEIALKSHNHTYVRLDGRMSRDARDKSMHRLREDPSVRVMLVSIGAGGLGLNLTTANKVFMMEPQFNPAAEAQAVDRVHRLGQDRDVTIKRFIMNNSFEEKMLIMQKKKKDLADLTMARERKSKEQATKQRLEELRSLFR
ncbi:SNF2 family helicase/ATPase-like protein [Plenodomus tracheiphilus IPT5]|uniref:SNF2 family helicase/ATPase-like protein n=1 Tax=Plenodomus tracheiphilus IPT5 TaxID=1408161 RepID=A0A6A7AX07_9PLEO|nr:SNF2 family helicase/ATPase-like protein [Plenodomus tracheiphilus IPT5]